VTIILSTGETLTLKDRFTHKMHKALFQAINKGVSWKQNIDTGDYEKEVPAENIEFQYEALFPLIIDKIEKGGTPVPYSQEWLDELSQEDFRKIEQAAVTIRNGEIIEAEGKKNTAKGQ